MEKFKNMNLSEKALKENYLVLRTEYSKPCLVCGEQSNFVEYCTEAHFCGPDCLKAFYDEYAEDSSYEEEEEYV